MSAKALGILLVVLAAAIESFAQLSLKLGARGRSRWIAAGVLLYLFEIAAYTLALPRLDIGLAFPLGSLCFVGVALLSRIFLGEAVGLVRGLGVVCIIAGAVLLTR